MSDLSKMEPSPGVRKTLMRAGIEMGEWSDRHLLSVELTANAVRQGERVFVPYEMQPMVSALVAAKKTDELR